MIANHPMCMARFNKGVHVHIVRYPSGMECEALTVLSRWAADPNIDFDWHDAAVLSYRMGQTQGGSTIGEGEA